MDLEQKRPLEYPTELIMHLGAIRGELLELVGSIPQVSAPAEKDSDSRGFIRQLMTFLKAGFSTDRNDLRDVAVQCARKADEIDGDITMLRSIIRYRRSVYQLQSNSWGLSIALSVVVVFCVAVLYFIPDAVIEQLKLPPLAPR
jgi:hypothetical protein